MDFTLRNAEEQRRRCCDLFCSSFLFLLLRLLQFQLRDLRIVFSCTCWEGCSQEGSQQRQWVLLRQRQLFMETWSTSGICSLVRKIPRQRNRLPQPPLQQLRLRPQQLRPQQLQLLPQQQLLSPQQPNVEGSLAVD